MSDFTEESQNKHNKNFVNTSHELLDGMGTELENNVLNVGDWTFKKASTFAKEANKIASEWMPEEARDAEELKKEIPPVKVERRKRPRKPTRFKVNSTVRR